MPRYLSIDVLRGIAILLMVQTHFVENLSAWDESSPFLWLYELSQYLGMVPAPLFAFVSGLSFSLWNRNQKLQDRRDETITKVGVRRGLFLFVLGIAFNFFVWLPEEVFNWDILTLIGAALVILAFARKIPPIVLGLSCLLILLLSPALREIADYQAYWDEEGYTYDFTLVDVLAGFVVNGYFPLFPWLVFPFAGFVVGEIVFKPRVDSHERTWRIGVCGLSAMVLAAIAVCVGNRAATSIAQHYTDGLTEFPATTTFLIGTLGLCLVSLALLHRCIDGTDSAFVKGRVLEFLSRCSAYSLSIYIIHHIVHLWPLWVYGFYIDQEDPQKYWRQAVSTPTALGLAVAFVAACYLILMWRNPARRFSFEALMRWLCD